jgi:outer membrane biosynthesis protein TonB
MGIVKQLRLLVVLAVSALAATGCATGAQVIADSPTLAVPPVPPRAIEPQLTVEPPEIEPVAPLPTPPSTPPKARPPAQRPSEPKPELKPEATPENTTAATTAPPAPVAPLRTATTPSGPEAVRLIRDTMMRAEAILRRVDYQKLSEDRRASYNAAKNFVQQAEEKIKQEDLRLAMDFATRAEIAAKTLLDSGR